MFLKFLEKKVGGAKIIVLSPFWWNPDPTSLQILAQSASYELTPQKKYNKIIKWESLNFAQKASCQRITQTDLNKQYYAPKHNLVNDNKIYIPALLIFGRNNFHVQEKLLKHSFYHKKLCEEEKIVINIHIYYLQFLLHE